MSQDRLLQEAVLAEFAWEPSINAAHIGMIADTGSVTLTDHLSNYLEKHAATRRTCIIDKRNCTAPGLGPMVHAQRGTRNRDREE